MLYELKPRKWIYILCMVFMTVVFLSISALMVNLASYDPMAEVGLTPIPGEYYPVAEKSIFDEPQYLFWIALLFAITVCTYVTCIITLRRNLIFDNTKFTVNGVTYTYSQIEKVHFYIHRRFSRRSLIPVANSFDIFVDGKIIHSYDERFAGYKEFHYYLDHYKVTVTPR